jgi:hypothetical protein
MTWPGRWRLSAATAAEAIARPESGSLDVQADGGPRLLRKLLQP